MQPPTQPSMPAHLDELEAHGEEREAYEDPSIHPPTHPLIHATIHRPNQPANHPPITPKSKTILFASIT
jgi:hypothetical protein